MIKRQEEIQSLDDWAGRVGPAQISIWGDYVYPCGSSPVVPFRSFKDLIFPGHPLYLF